MKGKLERLINLLHKRNFAEKIAAAGTVQKAKKIYKREWKFIGKQVDGFARDARKVLEDEIFAVDDFEIKSKDAVEIGWISFMTKIGEDDLISDYENLRKALDNVTGIKRKIARNMSDILHFNYLTQYTLAELLERS